MINRHPHIFGEIKVEGSADVLANWEAIKRAEKGLNTLSQSMEDIPAGMSALIRASKIQKKAAMAGFDWENARDAFAKVKEELTEFEQEVLSQNADELEKEAGDLLFAIVNVLRLMKINPEVALVRANRKFIDRFAFMERNAQADLKSLSIAQLDALWDEAKRRGL
jgi:tetrapyrrole methylase family protein/MazG family protein